MVKPESSIEKGIVGPQRVPDVYTRTLCPFWRGTKDGSVLDLMAHA